MAPELRKRKSNIGSEAQEPQLGAAAAATKKGAKSPKPAKRKATEDASPITMKKQKAEAVVSKKRAASDAATEVEKKKKAKKSEPATKKSKPVAEEPVSDVEEAADEDELDDQTQALVQNLDSESEEEDEQEKAAGKSLFKSGQDVGKIPSISAAAKKAVKKEKKPQQNGAEGTGAGIVYLGRIPHGFYEHEMRQYLSQFGPINRLRMARNKKTGASRHFAFVEFAEASTADIVAKTMDNYLLFGHILRCRVVAPEQAHADLWKGANRRYKAVDWSKREARELEKPLTESGWAGRLSKEEKKRAERAEKLKGLGYEFEAPKLKAAKALEGGDAAEPAKALEAPEEAQEAEAEEDGEKEKVEAEVEEPVAEKPKAKAKAAAAAKASKKKTAAKGSKAKKVKS